MRHLVDAWRQKAELLRPFAPEAARAFEDAATQLSSALDSDAEEALEIPAAARESGYHPESLRRLIREGKLPNAGSAHRLRLRRQDLPRKPVAAQETDILNRIRNA